ncbi:MAG: hypothetical protein HYT66_00225 [Candidatus Yanofskybacteria bacterium]|nr:hypothetical protein [Candidatus Yanofskybacteria bacterium]
MNKDLIIKIPLVSHTKDTGNKEWASRSCAICALKMVMGWKKPGLMDIPVMKLVKNGLEAGGYLKEVGWKHKVLVDIAGRYGVGMAFIEKFFRTKTQKTKGLGMINKKLAAGEPVLVSVFYKFNKDNGGHIVVLNGLRKNKNRITGYFIQDPEPGFRGANYFVSKEEFSDNWRGGLIYLL